MKIWSLIQKIQWRRLSKIGIKFDNILTRPTILKKKHLGNSSLKNQINILKKYFIKKKFDISRLPNEYKSILKLIKKVKV